MPCPSIDPKLFWTCPKCFGLDKKTFFSTELHILNHVQNVCFCPKQFGRLQNSFGTIARKTSDKDNGPNVV